ncbi:MAG: xanthine dehydrogenase family protein subunit M, partial [Acidobacteriota bacterium]|nr:xanthine dehydrogenase family protein subunit M [Acidobacteriota bacterium]
MRAYLPDYELRPAANLAEALNLLSDEPGVWRPFAGGTDLMVLFEAGRLAHKKFVNIWNLPELSGVEVTPDYVTLGALTTYTEVRANEVLRQEFPMLCQAASETGGLAIQNRGTLGGNIANASPAGDSPPALLVYNAELELVSAEGSRIIPYDGFHTGYKQMRMRQDELIKSIRLPRSSKPLCHYYRKVGTRKAQAISKICFAAVADVDGGRINEVRIALGSVAPTVIRCSKTEEVLRGGKVDAETIDAARAELAREISPIDDIRSTALYRLRVTQNVLEDFLT